MDTDTKQASSLSKVQIPVVLTRTGIFIIHFVEMVLVMCIAGAGLTRLVSFGIAQADNPNLIGQYPRLSILMIGILLAIPMAAWMRIRGHEWRPTLEMASTSIILAVLLVLLLRLVSWRRQVCSFGLNGSLARSCSFPCFTALICTRCTTGITMKKPILLIR